MRIEYEEQLKSERMKEFQFFIPEMFSEVELLEWYLYENIYAEEVALESSPKKTYTLLEGWQNILPCRRDGKISFWARKDLIQLRANEAETRIAVAYFHSF